MAIVRGKSSYTYFKLEAYYALTTPDTPFPVALGGTIELLTTSGLSFLLSATIPANRPRLLSSTNKARGMPPGTLGPWYDASFHR